MPSPPLHLESSDDPYVRALISVEVRLASMATASEGRHTAVLTAMTTHGDHIVRLEQRLEAAERALARYAEAEGVEAKTEERRVTEESERRTWLRNQLDGCVTWIKPKLDAAGESRAVQLTTVGLVGAVGSKAPGLLVLIFGWLTHMVH